MIKSPNWEMVNLEIKNTGSPVCSIFCYKSARNNYCPMIIGIDYSLNEKYSGYRQALFQLVKRAAHKGYNKIYVGMDASVEKKKVGARAIPKSAFVQANENYNMEVIGILQNNKYQYEEV